MRRSRLLTCYTSQLGFSKSWIVCTVTIIALPEGVCQAKALKLSFTNSCNRLLSKGYANDEQNLPIGPQANCLIISDTGKGKYKIRRIIILPAFIRKHCSEMRCIIGYKTSFSNRDINVSFISYEINKRQIKGK